MPLIDENNFTFLSADQHTQIHVREWVPDCDINGVVQISHGINEYVGRYADFANFLASRGFVVVGNDHLGHGQSVMSKDDLGFFDYTGGWQKAVTDIETLRSITAKKYPDCPYFILGHSMGSFMLRSYMIRYPNAPIDGVILSGTGQMPSALITAGKAMCATVLHREGSRYRSKIITKMIFGSYNKKFAPNRTAVDWISRDEAVVDKYVSDPLCTFIPCVSMLHEMLKGITYMSDSAKLEHMNKDLHVLFLSGLDDPVGDFGKGVIKAYGSFVRAGMEKIGYKLYPDGRHEMINELNKAEVYNDVLDWLFQVIYSDGF